ncbi:MAG: hypothetical protein [Arizlama microvirus]|nr:MAG: hypothetical protein [Arizlama microvirus]
MERKYYTELDRPDFKGEENSGEMITETAGYIPANVQIEDMMLAGQRLAIARKERFDGSNDEEVSLFSDPTRKPGFDLADAHTISREVYERLKRDEEKRKAEQIEKNKKVEEEREKLIEAGRKALEEGKNGNT